MKIKTLLSFIKKNRNNLYSYSKQLRISIDLTSKSLYFPVVWVGSMFIVTNLSSQSIKVKKGKVFFDKKPVALIHEPYRDHYIFSTLSGAKKLEVSLKGASNGTEEIYHFLKLSSPEVTQKAQLEYEVLVTSFKVSRIISHLLAVKYQVFTEKGISDAAIAKLFEDHKEDLEAKYQTIVLKSKQYDADREQREVTIRNRFYPQIHGDRSITFTQLGKMRMVGRINVFPISRLEANIQVLDLDGNKVAWF